MKYGVKLEAMPLRIYDYDIVCGSAQSAVDYPEEFELERVATVKDQGDVGACVACTIATVGEQLFKKEMSEAWAYGSLRADTDKKPGMYVIRALDLWRKTGLVPLSDFGILEEMPEMRELTRKFPDLLAVAEKYRIGGYASLDYADKTKKDKAIKSALMTDGIGLVAVSEKYFDESHCITLTGWNDKNNTYRFQNSWGADWKDGGCSEIPKEQIDAVYAVFYDEIELPFEDIKKDRWSYNRIRNAYMTGIVKGVSETMFAPEKPLTREEATVMIDRLFEVLADKIERMYKQQNEVRK
jgi:hypothetical protein